MVNITLISFRVFNIVIVSQSFLRQAHSLYQSEFYRQCHLVLLILIPYTFSIL